MTNKFLTRKNDVLARLDKSSKNSWDKNIVGLCDKINGLEDYYTTSSCAGRIVLMKDEDEKRPGLFIEVWHDRIGFEDLKEKLSSLCSEIDGSEPEQVQGSSLGKVDKEDNISLTKLNRSASTTSGVEKYENLKFKMEPCILHVACRDLECAQKLFNKAKLAGWKKSGIISFKDRVMLELNSTERLEFPVVCDGELLVEDKFLKIVVREANERLEKSWKKIERLGKLI